MGREARSHLPTATVSVRHGHLLASFLPATDYGCDSRTMTNLFECLVVRAHGSIEAPGFEAVHYVEPKGVTQPARHKRNIRG